MSLLCPSPHLFVDDVLVVPSVRRKRRRTDVRALTWAIAAGTRVGRRTRALRWSCRWARINRFDDRGNFSHHWSEFWPAEAPRPTPWFAIENRRVNCDLGSSISRTGCPTPAYVMSTIIFSGSGQYQIRPPPVTSYCHCSRSRPPIVLVARSSRNCAVPRRRGYTGASLLGHEILRTGDAPSGRRGQGPRQLRKQRGVGVDLCRRLPGAQHLIEASRIADGCARMKGLHVFASEGAATIRGEKPDPCVASREQFRQSRCKLRDAIQGFREDAGGLFGSGQDNGAGRCGGDLSRLER